MKDRSDHLEASWSHLSHRPPVHTPPLLQQSPLASRLLGKLLLPCGDPQGDAGVLSMREKGGRTRRTGGLTEHVSSLALLALWTPPSSCTPCWSLLLSSLPAAPDLPSFPLEGPVRTPSPRTAAVLRLAGCPGFSRGSGPVGGVCAPGHFTLELLPAIVKPGRSSACLPELQRWVRPEAKTPQPRCLQAGAGGCRCSHGE